MFSKKDIIVLGMMIFALFLGAGNIIFPPMEGYSAGNHWATASLGFVITGVLMPFITLVVVSVLGRGEELTKDLPKWAGVSFLTILYLVIGSTFAMPRITNVAYEMAWLPLGLIEDSATTRLIFSVIFNIIAMGFMIRPSTIISTVGEVMTPALLVLLLVVGITVFVSPLSDIVAPSQAYAENSALTTGLISGYQTMDVLAAIAFGGIVARALSAKNVTNPQKIVQYTISAGFVSVILLACLYFALFYLGATSDAVAQGATNGGQIFSRYAYPFWIVFFTAMTTIISQYGLTKLLRVTIPALLLIYPMAIMLVVLQLVRNKLPSIRLSYYVTIFVTVCFSLVDSLKNLDVLPEGLHQVMIHFPLYSQGLAWLVPALCTLLLSILLGKTISK